MHGHQYGNASHGAAVLEQDRIPLSVRRIDDTALCYAASEVSHIIVHHLAAGIFPVNTIRHKTAFRSAAGIPRDIDKENIILPVDLIDMRSFVAKIGIVAVSDDDLIDPAFLRSAQIRLQFRQMHFPVAIDDIHPAVIVEQNGIVVIKALDLVLLPRPLDPLRLIQIGLVCIIRHKNDVKRSVVIPQTRCPHPLSVDIFFPFQTLRRRGIQPFVHIGRMLPVHQIVRAQDLTSRHKIHRCAYHVVDLTHTDHIHIRIIRLQ